VFEKKFEKLISHEEYFNRLFMQERTLFITNDHEYLIEQFQDMTDTINSNNSKTGLIFDKPCKYIAWYVNLDKYFTRTPYLSWATDDNWDLAKDRFAKLVWLATREGLDCNDPTNPIIIFNDTYVNIGQVPPIIIGGNSILQKLLKLLSFTRKEKYNLYSLMNEV
jgi:hypothetical protein